jgi:GAF domain-containing protein
MGRAFVDAQPVHFKDVLTELDYDTRTRDALQSVLKYRSFLGVPILRDGTPIGVIGCGRRQVEPFAASQIALLQTFADQTAIAIENVRLFGELEARNREVSAALEQQTATAEVLGIINSSPGDLAPVFDAMLEKAIRLCDGAMGVLWTLDGERGRPAAARGVPAEYVALLRERGQMGTIPPLQQVMRGQRVIQFLDTTEHELYRSGDPVSAVAAGIRTLIWVALVKDGAPVGAFVIGRPVVRPFSEKQVALLQNFAAQAVIAMENARLLTETREALEQQTATAEILQVINSSPGNLAPVFDAMLEKAMLLCEAEFGLLTSFDGEAFHAAALRGVPASFAESWREPRRPGPGLALHRLTQGENLVHIPDVTVEDAYSSGDPIRRALADLGGARTGLWVALRKDSSLLGAFVIYRKEVRLFSDKQIALLQNFAAQAVIAMENARLITETREALERQTATAEVLQVINSSPGDLTPVFDAMLEKALLLCEAAHGHIWRYDGELVHAVAVQGTPRFVEWMREHSTHPPVPGSSLDRLLRGERFAHTADCREMGAYRASLTFRELIDAGGIRSSLMVPLRKDGTLLGAIAAFRQEVRPFTDRRSRCWRISRRRRS